MSELISHRVVDRYKRVAAVDHYIGSDVTLLSILDGQTSRIYFAHLNSGQLLELVTVMQYDLKVNYGIDT